MVIVLSNAFAAVPSEAVFVIVIPVTAPPLIVAVPVAVIPAPGAALNVTVADV